MSRLSFRLKLLLTMLLVVAGGGVATLLVTQQRVQETFERLYQQQFRRQLAYFSELQEARLEATRAQCQKLTQSEAIIAAFSQPVPDAVKLYALASAEFNETGGPRRVGQRGPVTIAPRRGGVAFYRFVTPDGKAVLPPEPPGSRRYTPTFRSRLDNQARFLAPAIATPAVQQIAYMSMEAESDEFGTNPPGPLRPRAVAKKAPTSDEPRRGFQEVLLTEVLAADKSRTLGAFVLGLPMPDLLPQTGPSDQGTPGSSAQASGIRAGMYFRGRLYANPEIISDRDGSELVEALQRELGEPARNAGEFNLDLDGTPHRVFFNLMNPGSVFPPAYQVCLFSMAEAAAEKNAIRWKIAVSSLAVLLGATLFGLVVTHQISAPLKRLTEGTHAVAQGNLDFRLPVRSRDDLGRLTHAFNEMAEGLALKEKYRTILNIVADEQVATQLVQGKISLGGELREISVLFCDIRDFTAHTQNMPPEAVIEMLNEHMTCLTAVVKAHHGVLDKFVGDLLMAVFGAPLHHENDAENAARCALALAAARTELNLTSQHRLSIGLGIATGTVVAGCMGSQDRMNYTVLGERVNLASRLCDSARADEVLIDEATRAKLGDRAVCEPKGEVRLKGFDVPIRVFRLHAIQPGPPPPPA